MTRTKFVAVVVFALSIGVSVSALADAPGPQIMGVTVTSSVVPDPAGYGIPSHLVDNSGMTADVQERGAPATAIGFRLHAWLQTPAVLTFDLGSVQAVGQMGLWNWLEFNNATGTSQDLKNFTLMYSSDDVTYTSLGLKQATRLNGEAPTPGGALSDHDNFTIGASARYIQIDIPYGAQGTAYNNYGSDFVGLGEVRFYAPVPEPGTFVLVCSSVFGVMAYVRRRHK
jgi:hypothetical protein